MPFTFAHPAAVVPLAHFMGRYAVISALVVGSIVPDIAHIVPIDVARHESHSLTGIFWFCLPASVLLYVLYHCVLKGPLLGLLPDYALQRLGPYAADFRALPQVPWRMVILSLFCGIVTHILWDTFTHMEEAGVTLLPFLRARLFTIGGYTVYLFKVLQHGSAIAGMLFIGWWCVRWLQRRPVQPVTLPIMLSSSQRVFALAAIIGTPALAGLCISLQSVEVNGYVLTLQRFIRQFVLAALPIFALVLVAFSIGWHALRLRAAQ
jgi:hypothetical protein